MPYVNVDVPEPGRFRNSLNHGQSNFIIDEGVEDSAQDDLEIDLFDRDQLVDVGDSRNFLLPGDLVELQ